MTRERYREYLRSPHWQATRLLALERAEDRCQVCNDDQRLQVHHRTYERLGMERDADLTVLCHACHELFHGSARKLKKTPVPKTKDRDALAKAIKAHVTTEPASTYSIAKAAGVPLAKTGIALARLRDWGQVERVGKHWRLKQWPKVAPTNG